MNPLNQETRTAIEKLWEEANNQLPLGVNPYAFIMGAKSVLKNESILRSAGLFTQEDMDKAIEETIRECAQKAGMHRDSVLAILNTPGQPKHIPNI